MLKMLRSIPKRAIALLAIVLAVGAVSGLGVSRVMAQNDVAATNHTFTPQWKEINRDIKQNPANPAPDDIRKQLISLEVAYRDFDGRPHEGTIEINRALKDDVIKFFQYAWYTNFPINKVAVSSDYNWDDNKLMAANITSGYNYRLIAGTNRPSKHGEGRAFDVNPVQNPYITLDDQGNPVVQPTGARWLPGTPGTLFNDQLLIQLMKSRGWIWGGNWTLQDTDGAVIDIQHLQKSAPTTTSTDVPQSKNEG